MKKKNVGFSLLTTSRSLIVVIDCFYFGRFWCFCVLSARLIPYYCQELSWQWCNKLNWFHLSTGELRFLSHLCLNLLRSHTFTLVVKLLERTSVGLMLFLCHSAAACSPEYINLLSADRHYHRLLVHVEALTQLERNQRDSSARVV